MLAQISVKFIRTEGAPRRPDDHPIPVFAPGFQIPNQTYQTEPRLANQTNPKLLFKAVKAWVRSAFGNVFSFKVYESYS